MHAKDLPEALCLFHARFRLRHDHDEASVVYDGDAEAGLYQVDVSTPQGKRALVLYSQGSEYPFSMSSVNEDADAEEIERKTNDPEELVDWLGKILGSDAP